MPTEQLDANLASTVVESEGQILADSPVMTPATLGTSGTDSLAAVEAGLDTLQTTSKRPLGLRTRYSVLRRIASPLLAVALVLAVWQLVVLSGRFPIWTVPGPQQVGEALVRAAHNGQLWEALRTSLTRGIMGFALSVAIGTPLGILISRVKWIRAAFGPIITGLAVLPSVAWVPAAIIWFGLSNATVFFVVMMGAVPSIINGLVAGVDQVPPLFRRVGHVLGARPWDMVTRIILPAALPGYLAGLKQGWAFSWRSLMAAEIIAVGGTIGFGLGALLQQRRDFADMAGVMAAIFLILIAGIAVEMLFFAPLERRILNRRGLVSETA